MHETLILTRQDVERLLTPELSVRAVETAFRAFSEGTAKMPPKVYLDLPEHQGDFRAMPSFMKVEGGEVAGVKWVNSHAQNTPRFSLPSVMGVFVLSDPKNALPLAILDATWLTAARTGAAAAVASKYLARKDYTTIGFVGCGVQARTMLAAHCVLGRKLEVLATDLNRESAEAFAAHAGGRATTLEEVVACDIVCTSTPSRAPVVQAGQVSPGTHINGIGADGPGKQELEPEILKAARVFVDDWEQASHSGEINVPLHDGAMSEADVSGALGDVVVGTTEGRTSTEDITVFDSTGLALQDLACAHLVFEAAKSEGLGQGVPLVGK